MLHVPGMPEGVHVSFSPEDQPVSAPAQPERYTPPAPVGAGAPSAAMTALLDAHELAYGHALCSKTYGLPDAAERRRAEEEAFRALLHTPMHSDADRVAYAIAVISRQMHSLGDGSATERDHPMAVAYRNLRFGEHAREPEEMRHVGRSAEPEAAADPFLAAIAAFDDAKAAFDAIEAELEQHGMTTKRWERESALGTAQARAGKTVWQTVPTTPAGRRALVEFARMQVALATHACGTIDEGEYWLGLILDAFAAMVYDPAGTWPEHREDPQVALVPALRQAYAWTRDAQPIINESKFASPEYGAADAIQEHCWRLADRILALPAPTTPAGLGAVALAMAVWTEGFIGLDPEIYKEERRHAAAIRAMMSVAGVTPLPEWSGFGDEPDSKARWDAMMKRAGEGSLPAWALAGKIGPDDEEIAIGEDVTPAVAPKVISLETSNLNLSSYTVPQLCTLFDVYERAGDHFFTTAWWPKLEEAGSQLVTDEGDRCMALKDAVADELQKRKPRTESDADERAEKLMRRNIMSGDWDDNAHLACRLRNEVAACHGKH